MRAVPNTQAVSRIFRILSFPTSLRRAGGEKRPGNFSSYARRSQFSNSASGRVFSTSAASSQPRRAVNAKRHTAEMRRAMRIGRNCEAAAFALGGAHQVAGQVETFRAGIDLKEYLALGGARGDTVEVIDIGFALQ
ncbi:MAG TPA: hypothetical protein VK493_14985 [Bryobacteraceae bacterium]|nr:hypothetical protein [Bryobacteraceae bacterium]